MTKRKRVNTVSEVNEEQVNSNLNLQVKKVQKSTVNKKSNLRAMQQELKDIDLSKSNSIAKDSKQVSKTFKNATRMQLSLIKSDSRLTKYEKTKIVELLLESAKSRSKVKEGDVNYYAVLRAISEFSYSAHKEIDTNKVTTINIVKSFNAKQVLNSAEIYLHYNADDYHSNLLTAQKINDIQHERELQAVEKCENDVTRLQNKLNSLSVSIETYESIENRTEEQNDQLIEFREQLTRTENNLLIAQKIYDYVKLQSNRKNIK